MAIPPISAPISPVAAGPAPVAPAAEAGGSSFVDGLKEALNSTGEVNALAQDLATGELTDVHQFTVAAEKAALAMELTVAVRDRALAAYQEVMRMQL
jgi:flagellar hook-basal body complex protein FliE